MGWFAGDLIWGMQLACLQCYVDSDIVGSLDTRKSITGYIFTLYGAVVSWKGNLQSVVALSTTKAKYITLAEAVKELLRLRGMISDLGID